LVLKKTYLRPTLIKTYIRMPLRHSRRRINSAPSAGRVISAKSMQIISFLGCPYGWDRPSSNMDPVKMDCRLDSWRQQRAGYVFSLLPSAGRQIPTKFMHAHQGLIHQSSLLKRWSRAPADMHPYKTDRRPAPWRQKRVLPPFRNIRCFSFMKWVYLDIF
jgi:hypothetical protein